MREPPYPVLGLDVPEVSPRLVAVQPRVQQALVHREPLPGLDLEEVGYDVYGLAGDLLPGVGRVHEGSVLDLLVDVLVLVEGESPGQADLD